VGSFEHVNKLSGSIKGEEFLYQLGDYWLLTKKSAPCSSLVKKALHVDVAALTLMLQLKVTISDEDPVPWVSYVVIWLVGWLVN
jgi:hypothetical protein